MESFGPIAARLQATTKSLMLATVCQTHIVVNVIVAVRVPHRSDGLVSRRLPLRQL